MNALKSLTLLSLLSLYLTSFSQGQLIEKNIILPSPNSGQLETYHGVLNNVKNTIYVCGTKGHCIIECDAATHQPLQRIHINFGADHVLFNSVSNKLYASEANGDSLVVIDCASNNILKYLPMDDTTDFTRFAYNEAENKVYIGRTKVLVLDGATEQVLAEFQAGYVYDIEISTQSNKVYASAYPDNQMLVIDGRTNALIHTIDMESHYYNLCYNSENDKIFCGSTNSSLLAIDVATDTLITFYHTNVHSMRYPAYNPISNKVYVGYIYPEEGMLIIDGETNEVLRNYEMEYETTFTQFNPATNTVYAKPFHEDYFLVIDGVSDDIIDTVPMIYNFMESMYNPVAQSVIYFNPNHSLLDIFDANTHSEMAPVPLGTKVGGMVYNTSSDKIYVKDNQSSLVTVVDAIHNQAIDHIFLDTRHPWGEEIEYVPGYEKVYIAHTTVDYLSVIDCNNDEYMGRITVGNYPYYLTYCPTNHYLYSSSDFNDFLTVIDVETDEVVEHVDFGDTPMRTFYHEGNNRLYIENFWKNEITILDCSDHSVVTNVECVADVGLFAYSESNHTLYMGGRWAGQVGALDCSTNTVEIQELVPRGYSYDMAFNPVNLKMYIPNFDSCELYVVDCKNLKLLNTITVEGQRPRTVSYQPESNQVIAGFSQLEDGGGHSLQVIDGETDQVVMSAPCGAYPNRMLYDPELKKTYVGYSLYSMLDVINDTTLFDIPEFNNSAGNKILIGAYPNPANDKVNIRYHADERGLLRLHLYSADGSVWKHYMEETTTGEYILELDTRDLPAGTYIINIQLGKTTDSGKLVVVR